MNFYGEVINQSDRPLAGVGLLIEIFNDRDERLARGGTQDLSSNIIQAEQWPAHRTQDRDLRPVEKSPVAKSSGGMLRAFWARGIDDYRSAG